MDIAQKTVVVALGDDAGARRGCHDGGIRVVARKDSTHRKGIAMQIKLDSTLRTIIGVGIVSAVLSACGTTKMNMIDVQRSTAKTIGLASSDELTIDNVQYGQKNGLGGQQVSYDATTGKGRRFTCTVFMIPGLTPIDRPTYNNWECHPHS